MPYVWLGILVFAIAAEAMTAGLVSIWFVPSALIAMILAFIGVPEYLQWIVFVGLSAVLLVLSKTIWKKYLQRKPAEATNSDALIGKTGIVTVAVDNLNAVGEVKVSGQHWSARSESGEALDVGDTVTVVAIEGVKLICKKI